MPALEPIRIQDASLFLDRHFLDPAHAWHLLETLSTTLAWRQDHIRVFGKTHPIPRLQVFQGEAGLCYRYSHLSLTSQPWHPQVEALRTRLQQVCQTPFNCVLINYYRNGADRMGWHSDDEPELGHNPVIASVSLGATRRFVMRHRYQKTVAKLDLTLEHGSLLLMAGRTQHFWQHALPASKPVQQGRINLTFRYLPTEESL